ncbi:MAG: hypothetical protein EPO65_11410 [Dehalococcoidia bacterium]|nr:MAG: hypothetical protein EPO65_11410 [Dehalococcoidia bacterium]
MRNVDFAGSGKNFDVYVAQRGHVKEFLDSLAKESRDSMQAVIAEHMDNGPLRNEEKSRELDDGIYEFKNRQGARVFWFYPKGQRRSTVLTHGCLKPKKSRLGIEVQRAKDLRDEVMEAGL